jgi:hypothetical protein
MPALQPDFATGTQALPVTSNSMVLEILHRFLVLLRRRPRLECPKIAPFPCLRIFLPRIQTITARLKFSDHDLLPGAGRATSPPAHGQGLGAMDDRAIFLSDATS